MMAELVYILCAAMSVLCAVMLLYRNHKAPSHLLFWSGLCFAMLAVNNVFLFADLVIFYDVPMQGAFWRSVGSALAGSLLLFGLIWELT